MSWGSQYCYASEFNYLFATSTAHLCFMLHVYQLFQGYHPYIGMTEVGTKFLQGLGEHLGNMLSTDEVGEAGAKIIETAKTASVWHIHQKGETAYEIPNERESLADVLKFQPK